MTPERMILAALASPWILGAIWWIVIEVKEWIYPGSTGGLE